MASSDANVAADFELLLAMEAVRDASDGWKFSASTDTCIVWTKKAPGQNNLLVKSYQTFPGIRMEVMRELLSGKVRDRFEPSMYNVEVLEENDDYKIIYSVLRLPSKMTDRELIGKEWSRGTDEESLKVRRTTTHPSKPPIAQYVRGEVVFSGTTLRRKEDDPDSSVVTLVNQLDLKGWIPTSVSNPGMAGGPLKFHAALLDFYHNTYKAELEAAGQ